MGGEWKETTLGEICKQQGGSIQTGPFGSQLHASDYQAKGIPVVMPVNLIGGRIDEKGIARVSLAEAERLARHKLNVGDIVFSRRGDVTRFALVSENELGWLCGTGCLKVSLGRKTEAIPGYIAGALAAPDTKEWLTRHAVGATMPNLNTEILSAIPVSLPPIEEQRAIAHILGRLDDKIELNRQQNKTLEEMARALFKAWFVDFEPVRAKMEGRWQPGQSLPGLPAHLYDMFPDRLVETEQGEIPQGWGVGKLADLCELKYGKALKAAERRKGEIPVYGSGGITGFHDKALVTNPTIIVGRKGTVGSLYWESGPCFPIDTVFYVDPKVSLSFCYHAMMFMRLHQLNTDAAVPGLNRDNAYRQTVIVPDAEMLQEWDSIALFVREKIDATDRQSRALAQLRNTLLPKLISGELRVADTANFMENASSGFIERDNKESES